MYIIQSPNRSCHNCLSLWSKERNKRIKDILMKNLSLKDNQGREKSEQFLKRGYNIPTFQREKMFNVYKQLEMAREVHFIFLR